MNESIGRGNAVVSSGLEIDQSWTTTRCAIFHSPFLRSNLSMYRPEKKSSHSVPASSFLLRYARLYASDVALSGSDGSISISTFATACVV